MTHTPLLRAAIRATKYGRYTLAPADLRVLEALLDHLHDEHYVAITQETVAICAGMRLQHAGTSMRNLIRAGFLDRSTLPDGRRTYRFTIPTTQEPGSRQAA